MTIDPATKALVRSIIREFLLEVDYWMEQEKYTFGHAVNAAMKSLGFEDSIVKKPDDDGSEAAYAEHTNPYGET